MSEISIQEVVDNRPTGFRAVLSEFWSYFSENRGAVVGLIFFIGVVLIAVFADFIAPHAPNQQYREALLQPPFWQAGGDIKFPLGTDAIGRDMLSRLIHGSQYSLFIGCIVVSLSLAAGVILGLLAGFTTGDPLEERKVLTPIIGSSPVFFKVS